MSITFNTTTSTTPGDGSIGDLSQLPTVTPPTTQDIQNILRLIDLALVNIVAGRRDPKLYQELGAVGFTIENHSIADLQGLRKYYTQLLEGPEYDPMQIGLTVWDDPRQ